VPNNIGYLRFSPIYHRLGLNKENWCFPLLKLDLLAFAGKYQFGKAAIL